METNYLFSPGIAYQNLFPRGVRRFVVLLLIFPSLVYAQPTPKNWEVARDVGNGCKQIVHKSFKFDLIWTGECKEGYANGIGIGKIYENGKLTTISKVLMKNGREDANDRAEQYGIDDEIGLFYSMRAPGEAWTKDAAVPPSQVPEWAREIVDGRPRQPTPTNVATQQSPQKSSSTTARSSQIGTSRETKSGGASYNHRLMVLYNSEAFAAPTVVHDDAMLQAIIAQHRENLEYNQADSEVRSKECQQGSSNGPYFGFVHYQAVGRGRRQAWGLSCGASSPEEAFQLAQRACESNSSGGRCAVDTSASTHRRVIIIGDRRIVSGRKEAEARDVSVLIRESYADAQSGYEGGANINVNFNEGYICRWTGIISDSRYWGGRRFQMDVNGPFTWGKSRPVGQYEFNCGSKL